MPPPLASSKRPTPPEDTAVTDGPKYHKIKIETKKHGVREYGIMTLDADAGAAMFGRIASYIGGPIAGAILAGTGAPYASQAMVSAIQAMTAQMSEEPFREAIWTLIKMPTVNGKEIKEPKHHFAENYGALMRLGIFALQANYASFSDGVPPEMRERLTMGVARLSRHVAKMSSFLESLPLDGPPSKSSDPSTPSPTPSASTA